MEIVPGPGFPDRRHHPRPRRHPRRLSHRARLASSCAAAPTSRKSGKDREAIVVTEIPYQVNKARLIERIAELVRDKMIEGISDLRDESDRDGVRVVIELKRDAMAEVVLNQLYRFTPLQTTFGVNMLALNGGRPLLMNLKDVIAAFIAFREEVVTRRTAFELGKARERAHVLVGLADRRRQHRRVIALIRAAADPTAAREAIDGPRLAGGRRGAADQADRRAGAATAPSGTYRLSEAQARAILDLRLQRLTGLERDKIAEELGELAKISRAFSTSWLARSASSTSCAASCAR